MNEQEAKRIEAIIRERIAGERQMDGEKHGVFLSFNDWKLMLKLLRSAPEGQGKSFDGCGTESGLGVVVSIPPEGHILDSRGVVRRVLGTLPLTADGCVVGLGAVLHNAKMPGIERGTFCTVTISGTSMWCDHEQGSSPARGATLSGPSNPWFSTRSAAEGAGGERP